MTMILCAADELQRLETTPKAGQEELA